MVYNGSMKKDNDTRLFRTIVVIMLAVIIVLLAFIRDDLAQIKSQPTPRHDVQSQQV